REYHVLVLDDGSTDDTAEVVEPYTRVLPCTLLREKHARGYAGATERLLREAVRRSEQPRRDMVVMMQADFTDSPEDLPSLVKRIEGGADLVAGLHAGPAGGEPLLVRWARKAMPWMLRGTVLPAPVANPLSGFRAYRVSTVSRALAERGESPLLTFQGQTANAELLLAVAPHARRVDAAELPPRPTLRQRPTRSTSWETLKDLWSLRRLPHPTG
ncbi:MAG: hypothetical protein AVDCRST_MAG89-5297, partial [uncultured Gemmatimonadetes bacterium]